MVFHPSAGQPRLVLMAEAGVQERTRGRQGHLNWTTCYFHCILLAKQVTRPDEASGLVFLWPRTLKTLWGLYILYNPFH